MKLVTFAKENEVARVGLLVEDLVIDLQPAGIGSMLQLLQAGQEGLARVAAFASTKPAGIPLSDVKLLAPVPKPPRVFGIGLNYADHAAESQMKVQAVPTVFMKLSSSVVGPDVDIILPKNATQPDYEAELAVVIGKPGYRISAADADQYVFGYTICHDVSARDVQLATSQWTLGKSFPTFTPLGPVIVTKDEIGDAHALDISLTIDGETLQDSNTKHLIFRVPQIIEHISSLTPLEAGDVISTGTPHGVGLGRTPQRWLKPGELVEITVEKIGKLRNRTVAETE